jgi:hypothetical protein
MFLATILPVLSIQLSIIKTGLISLPQGLQLLKLHHMVLLEDKNEKVVVDLIPLSLNKSNFIQLLLGKSIPATIRIRKIPVSVTNKNLYSFLCSPVGKTIVENRVNSLSLNLFLYRINNWYELKKNSYTMNIYKRNCHHYRSFVEHNYRIYCGKYS